MKQFVRRTFFDWRGLVLLIPAGLVLASDVPVLLTLGYSLAAIFVIVGMAHIIRRIMFPYLDLEEVENKASETSTGAGLVFLGVCLLVSAIILGSAMWIGGR